MGYGVAEVHHPLKQLQYIRGQFLRLLRGVFEIGQRPRPPHDERLLLQNLVHHHPSQPLHQHAGGTVGQLQHPTQIGQRSNGVQILGGHILFFGVLLGEDDHPAIAGQGRLNCGYRPGARHQ